MSKRLDVDQLPQTRENTPATGGRTSRDLRADAAALALLLLLCLLFFWPLFAPASGDRSSFRAGDFYEQTYACSTYKARALWEGRLPLWNPYVHSGHPFLADLQNSPLYPLSLLTVLLSGPGGYSVLALEIEAVAHFFLAAAFAYFLGRRLFGYRGVAFFVAVAFAFGGYLTSFPPLQLPILETSAWLPLVLLLLDVAAEQLNSNPRVWILACLLAGASLGIALLVGHPQTAMYIFYPAVAWYLFRASGRGGPPKWRGVAGLALFAAAAGGLAAVELLPGFELMRLSIRASASYSELGSGWQLQDLLQIVQPGIASYWSPLYLGVLPLVWVVYAWVSWPRLGVTRPGARWRRDVVFWSGVALISLLVSLGGNSFVYSLFYLAVPGFGLFRSQERIALVWSMAMVLLSGYGLRHFADLVVSPAGRAQAYRVLNRVLLPFLASFLALALLLFVIWTFGGGGRASLSYGFMSVNLFLSVVLFGGWLWAAGWSRAEWRAVPAFASLVALLVLDLFTINSTANIQDRAPEDQVRSTPVVESLQSASEDRPFRVYHGGWALSANDGCIFALEDISGASQMHLAAYADFLDRLPMERAWELLNVRYVVTWNAQLHVPSTVAYHTVTEGGDAIYVHRLESDHPRAWMVFDTTVLPRDEALERLSRVDWARYDVAILDSPLDVPLQSPPSRGATLRVTSPFPEEIEIEVDTPARGLLVLSELYYPGWQATVDGQAVDIHRVNTILRGVVVPAGSHHVKLAFHPPLAYLGLGLSLLTALCVAGYTVWVLRQTRDQVAGYSGGDTSANAQ